MKEISTLWFRKIISQESKKRKRVLLYTFGIVTLFCIFCSCSKDAEDVNNIPDNQLPEWSLVNTQSDIDIASGGPALAMGDEIFFGGFYEGGDGLQLYDRYSLAFFKLNLENNSVQLIAEDPFGDGFSFSPSFSLGPYIFSGSNKKYNTLTNSFSDHPSSDIPNDWPVCGIDLFLSASGTELINGTYYILGRDIDCSPGTSDWTGFFASHNINTQEYIELPEHPFPMAPNRVAIINTGKTVLAFNQNENSPNYGSITEFDLVSQEWSQREDIPIEIPFLSRGILRGNSVYFRPWTEGGFAFNINSNSWFQYAPAASFHPDNEVENGEMNFEGWTISDNTVFLFTAFTTTGTDFESYIYRLELPN